MSALIAVVYLGLALALLSATVGAFRPAVYGPHVATAFSFAGMMVTFWIPQVLMIGIAFTSIVALAGGFRHATAVAGLGIHVACWTLLVVYARRMTTALPVLDGNPVLDAEHPFTDGVPDDERDQLPHAQVSWGPSFTYRSEAMRKVHVVRNVVYREVDGVRLRVDIYRPRDRKGPHPSAVYIHGGGWVVGSRRQSRFMMYELAAAGWTVFAIAYRRAPAFPLPAAIVDCKAAVAWVREHASEYDAQPDKLVVIGGSAGGHLAAMVALTPNRAEFQPGFENAETTVQGAVVLYGVTDLEAAFGRPGSVMFRHLLERWVFRKAYSDEPDLFRNAQPLTHVSADAPPMLLVHGTVDRVVPFEQSRAFAERLREAGARTVHLLEIPHGQHAFEVFPSPLHQRSVRIIARFMDSVRRGVG
jgi:acetyl esterase/lipase